MASRAARSRSLPASGASSTAKARIEAGGDGMGAEKAPAEAVDGRDPGALGLARERAQLGRAGSSPAARAAAERSLSSRLIRCRSSAAARSVNVNARISSMRAPSSVTASQ